MGPRGPMGGSTHPHSPDGSPHNPLEYHGGTLDNIKHSIEDATHQLLETAEPQPCTIVNEHTNQFFDLRPLGGLGLEGEVQAWNAKGFDYGRNFSIGVCFTPLRQLNSLSQVDFKETRNRTNVGAYYTKPEGNKVSIGQVSTDLRFRGKKLVLEYNNGDICPNLQNAQGEPLRKSTLLSFTCDREIMKKARVNYLGSFNNCSYHFEVRTIHACATANDASDDAVWLIFAGVFLAAVLVYLCANTVYAVLQRHYEAQIKHDALTV